jgi:putative FmdB family regulatory protein
MIYDFQCQTCGEKFEYECPVENRDETVTCDCGADAKRIFSPTVNLNAGAAAFKAEKYHAFGKVFTQKSQIKEEIRKIEGETGRRIVETGNDSTVYKPKRTQFDWDGIGRELTQLKRKIRGTKH